VSYRVTIAHEAEKILDRLGRPTERRLRIRIAQLADGSFDPRLSTPLVERAGIRKSRVGGWRIVCSVDREAEILYVLTVDTRGQV
jgi:mRNA-degrading endonuclease RelE of RelBE toxin-antitoxin system